MINVKHTQTAHVYPPVCNHNHMSMEYHYPMIKVEWLSAGGVLLILNSLGLITGQICRRRICSFLQPMGIKGELTLINKKEKLVTNYRYTLKTWSSRVGFKCKTQKYKTIFFKFEHLRKTCREFS